MKKKVLIIIITLLFILLPTSCFYIDPNPSEDIIPNIDVLIENNEIETILNSYENVTIDTTYTVLNDSYKYNQFFYNIDDNIVMDSYFQRRDYISLISYRGYASYIVNDGFLDLYIYDTLRENKGVFETIENPQIVGKSYEEYGCWVVNFWCKSTEPTMDEKGIYYTAWFDKHTMLADRLVGELYSDDLELLGTIDSVFSYNEDSFELEKNAVDYHLTKGDAITIDFVFNKGLENENTIVVNTDKSTSFMVLNDESEVYNVYYDTDFKRELMGLFDVEETSITLYVDGLKQSFAFEKRFTTKHLETIEKALEEYKQAGLGSDTEAFDKANENIDYYINYMYSQRNVYLIEYNSNPNDTTASEYSFLMNSFYSILAKRNESIELFAKESPIKDYIFEGYTEEELEELERDNTLIVELEQLVSDMEIEYQAIDKSTQEGLDESDQLYLEMSIINNQIASLNGYDNYYEFESIESYKRLYTKEQREALREYTIEYVLPLYLKTNQYCQYYDDELTSEESNDLSTISYGLLSNNPGLESYIYDYIDIYKGYDLYDNMMSAFTDDVIFTTNNKNSLGTGFTSWDPIYNHSVIYLSYYYNDVYTIIHELGHYASFYYYDFFNLGYDISETFSQANEWIFTYHIKDSLPNNVANALEMEKANEALKTILMGVIVDDFEESLYEALAENEDFTITDLRKLLDDVYNKYTTSDGEGIKQNSVNVTIREFSATSPVYYLSYATSQIASLSFGHIASTEGLDAAKTKYVKLLEKTNPNYSFMEIVESLDLLNPFEEETFIKINEMFRRYDIEYALARKDVIYAESDEIKPLLEISKDNELVNFNEDGKVFMIYFTNNYGEYYFTNIMGTAFGNLRMLSADELINWYKENSEGVTNWDQRLTELLGFKVGESRLGFIGMWVDVEDLDRLAYQTDINKQLQATDLIADSTGNYLSMDDSIEEYILGLRDININFVEKVFYTLLGYTYDLSGDDVYGLSEFLLEENADVEIEFSFDSALKLVEWLETQLQ